MPARSRTLLHLSLKNSDFGCGLVGEVPKNRPFRFWISPRIGIPCHAGRGRKQIISWSAACMLDVTVWPKFAWVFEPFHECSGHLLKDPQNLGVNHDKSATDFDS